MGGTFFFTVTLKDRNSTLLIDHIDQLRSAFKKVSDQSPFTIDAIVVLPEHLHTIWTLPKNDDDYPKRWRAIKSLFTHSVKKKGIKLNKNIRGEYHTGNVDIGNIQCVTKMIYRVISIIFITTQSNIN